MQSAQQFTKCPSLSNLSPSAVAEAPVSALLSSLVYSARGYEYP